MSEVLAEFEHQLEAWRRAYAGRPEREMLRLFLLALEREQLVAVAYRETLIARRLATMPLPHDVREIIRHALLWIWKDEEMHAVYIRGVLLQLGGLRLRLGTFAQQAMGGLAGWAASVRHHLRFSQAPLARCAASFVALAGLLAGKVPRAVRSSLAYGSFRQFCAFNIDAELTASRCWSRLVELAAERVDSQPALVAEFQRMKADEDRHARVFGALLAGLDEQDRLIDGESADAVAQRIGAIGEFFLPPERRPSSDNPVGRGGTVWVLRGSAASNKLDVLEELLDACDLAGRLADRARALGKPTRELRVAVKPTFMVGYHRRDLSPITDPELVAALARRLRAGGVLDVAIVESPTIYDRFYRNRDVRQVARYFGVDGNPCRVVDLSEDQVPHTYLRGMAQHSVGRTWKEADFRVSFAKLRSNPVDVATLTVANLEGLGPRQDQYFFAERQAQRDTILMMLLAEFPPQLALLDAYDSAPDGTLGMMGKPRPKTPRRMYAGSDPMAVDSVALRHIGVQDPDRSNLLRAARQWFGAPRAIQVVGCDEPIPGWKGPFSSDWSTLLSLLAYPVYQFGSGRGSLFVPQMDEAAFPPVTAPGPFLRAGRRLVQTLFGLRLPG